MALHSTAFIPSFPYRPRSLSSSCSPFLSFPSTKTSETTTDTTIMVRPWTWSLPSPSVPSMVIGSDKDEKIRPQPQQKPPDLSKLEPHMSIRPVPLNQGTAVSSETVEWSVPEMSETPQNLLEKIVWKQDELVNRNREKLSFIQLAARVKSQPPQLKSRAGLLVEKLQQAAQSRSSQGDVNAVAIFLADSRKPVKGAAADLSGVTIVDKDLAKYGIIMVEPSGLIEKLQLYKWESLLHYCNDQSKNVAGICIKQDNIFFGAKGDELKTVKEKLAPKQIPIICTDVISQSYQVFQARLDLADAVTLMAKMFTKKDLNYFFKFTKSADLLPIIEVTSRLELQVALDVPDVKCIMICDRDPDLLRASPGHYVDLYMEFQKQLQEKNILLLSEGNMDELMKIPREIRPHGYVLWDWNI